VSLAAASTSRGPIGSPGFRAPRLHLRAAAAGLGFRMALEVRDPVTGLLPRILHGVPGSGLTGSLTRRRAVVQLSISTGEQRA